ncbi:ATP-binding protein [Natronoglycomyces albus]|uniref:ATP-binding protein n=1 Tax=Natronoglycomyces albus TaxID=2811108 RepID=A0A895XSQ2_9ACTN|nr:ATP-binding protein [Natronoglycomyces albus]QSB06349.1 ATP-binding protein [Natronoglycomyces albus]
MTETAPVGRVLGTEDSTPLSFWVGVSEGQYAQLDDVLTTLRTVPGVGQVETSGVVTAVRSRHEGAQFDSDVFDIASGLLPAQIQEAAEVTVTRVEPEVFVPPQPGQPVHRAEGADRERALFFDGMTRKIPLGFSRDGLPVVLNPDFLDGTRGAHVSISGVSGVATKTSFATWLLYSMLNSQALGGEAKNTKALIFNVKGEDLLLLDHPNSRTDETIDDHYHRLGLSPGAFASVSVLAPPRPGDVNGTPDVACRSTGVAPFYWTLDQFCHQKLLPFVFADADDDRQQYTMVVHQVAAQLEKTAQAKGNGSIVIDGQHLTTYDGLVQYICDRLSDEDDRTQWAGSAVGLGTVNAFIRRLVASERDVGRLVRGDLAPQADSFTTDAQVTVVDLHNLPDRAQRFVVGVILRSEFDRKEKAGSARPLQFIVLDELNKYAPREGSSPIKELLLDIAERGRSLGVILIGAQQTASEVERRIVANSAIKVVGRLDAAEAGRPEYGFLSQAQRQRVLMAKPGTMFVAQPELPVPLVVNFPFPTWATRPSEAGPPPKSAASSVTAHHDPFALSDHDDDIPF